MGLREKTEAFIKEHGLLKAHDSILIGFSGGADSMALLEVLWELRKSMDLSLAAVHVHHGIRKEADADAAFCKEICIQKQIPFYCEYADVPRLARERHLTEEEAGRNVRYEIFERYRRDLDMTYIAVAHHQNDQAETMLFQLFRGSGLRGLAGIPIKRGVVIRPLLGVTRAEIEAYLEKKGLFYVTDQTNQSNAYTRNKIRHDLIPTAQQISQGAVQHMGQTSFRLREVLDYMTIQADTFLKLHSVWEGQTLAVSLKAFEQEHAAVQKMVVMEAVKLSMGSRKDITQSHVEGIISLTRKQGEKKLQLPKGGMVLKSYEWLRFTGVSKEQQKQQVDVIMLEPDQVYILSDGRVLETALLEMDNLENIPKNDCIKWFDYDKIGEKLLLRTREQGDYLTIRDDGAKKSLKEYLINEKIPRQIRDTWPVLADGKHIVWVLEKRISAYYKITAQTKKILQIYIGGEKNG